MDAASVTPGPDGLKALSHPVRLRLLGALRTDGPATATTLAHRLGLNTGAASYHLRQLERHGFVVDDPGRGNARERWWQAAHRATHTELSPTAATAAEQAALQETLDAYLQSVVVVYAQNLQRSVEERPLLPPEWREATTYSDWVVRLRPRQAQRVVDSLMETFAALADEPDDGSDDGPDAPQPFTLQLAAFPVPGRLGGYAEPAAAPEDAGDSRGRA
jgi:DNA-binding transcriptional ArsR family regulator